MPGGVSIFLLEREKQKNSWRALETTALPLVTRGGGHTRAKFELQCDDLHKKKVIEKVPGSGLHLLFIDLSESYSPAN